MTALPASAEEEAAEIDEDPDEAGISLGWTVTYEVDEATVTVTAAALPAVELDGVPFWLAPPPPVREGAAVVVDELAASAVTAVPCRVLVLSAVTLGDAVELPPVLSPGTSLVAAGLDGAAIGETMVEEDVMEDDETREAADEEDVGKGEEACEDSWDCTVLVCEL